MSCSEHAYHSSGLHGRASVGGMGHRTLAIKGISGGCVGCSKGKLLVALALEEVVQSLRVESSER